MSFPIFGEVVEEEVPEVTNPAAGLPFPPSLFSGKSDETVVDFPQFGEVVDERANAPRSIKESIEAPILQAGGKIISQAGSLPRTALDLLSTGVEKLEGGLEKLGFGKSDNPLSNKLRAVSGVYPSSKQIGDTLEKAFDDPKMFQQRNVADKAANLFGGFVGDFLPFGAVGTAPLWLTGSHLLGEASDISPNEQLFLDVLATGGKDLVKGAGKKVLSPGKLAASSKQVKDSAHKGFLEASKKYNVKLPASVYTGSGALNQIENALSKMPASSGQYDKLIKEMTNDITKNYKQQIDNISRVRYATLDDAESAVKSIIDKSKTSVESAYSKAYKDVLGKHGSEIVDSSGLKKFLSNQIPELNDTLLKAGATKSVASDIEDILSKLSKGDITVNKLHNTKREIHNKLSEYYRQGMPDVRGKLAQVGGEINKALKEHGKENPRFIHEYGQANKQYQDFANKFKKNPISKAFDTNNPKEVLNLMQSKKGIKQVRDIMELTPEGKQAYQRLQGTIANERLSKWIEDSATGQIKWAPLNNELMRHKEYYKELLGDTNFREFSQFSKFVKQAGNKLNKFANYSGTAQQNYVMANAGAGFAAIISAMGGNLGPLVYLSGVHGATNVLARVLTSPKMRQDFYKAINSAQPSSSNAFLKEYLPELAKQSASSLRQKESNGQTNQKT